MRAEGTLTMRRVRAEEAREREARCARAERQSRRVLCAGRSMLMYYTTGVCVVCGQSAGLHMGIAPEGGAPRAARFGLRKRAGILYHTYLQRKQQSNPLTK